MKRVFVLISIFLFSCVHQQEMNKIHISPLKLEVSNDTQKSHFVLNREKNRNNVQPEMPDIVDVNIASEKRGKRTSFKVHREHSYRFPEKFVKISVENMPVNDFILLVFNKVLKVNYYIEDSVQNVKGSVTLKMQEKISADKFFSFVVEMLKGYGISVRFSEGVFRISRKSGISKEDFKTTVVFGKEIPEDITSSQLITQVVPLYYISASRYLPVLKMVLSPSARVQSITDGNVLVVTDKASNIRVFLEFVDIFDKPVFTERQVKLVRLEFLQPDEFIKHMKKVLTSIGVPVVENPRDNGVVLTPVSLLSSVLVVSPKKEWLEQLIFWKRKLDIPEAVSSGEKGLFIYQPKNRNAKELVDILNTIAGGAAKGKKSLSRGFKVVLDKERNSVIVSASPEEYFEIKRLLERLDTVPRQVLIDVTIAEVTLKDDLQYGVEWYLRHSGRFTGELQTLGGLGVGGGGFVYSLVSSTQKFQAVLNAFAQKNLINILSTPRVVVLDNHQASINVGTQVPVITSETTSADVQSGSEPSILRNVEYRTTGVTLNVKPVVHSNGILTLDIKQEVSEAQTNNISNIDSPIILNRSINTSVVLKNGQTAILGGLISQNRSKSVNKVPLFGDVPLFGNMFKSTSWSGSKTELIVMITPYIISSSEQMEMIVDEVRKRFDIR